MANLPKISDTEWEIMKVLWAKAPRSAGEIIETLATRDTTWHPKTVKTFLTRLVNKGALGFKKEKRSYLYHPLVSERQCVEAASESFLERVFGGSLSPMLAHFVERKKLTPRELQDLQNLLEEGKR